MMRRRLATTFRRVAGPPTGHAGRSSLRSKLTSLGRNLVMSERTATLASHNYWNELMAMRDEQRDRRKSAVQVVRLAELPLENNEQGLMRWYLHPAIRDTILSTL